MTNRILDCSKIIEIFLREKKYDGLYCDANGCACKLDELFPYDCDFSTCEAGYLIDKNSEDFDDTYTYMIGPDKPARKDKEERDD